jgi:hypothetical protein
LISKLKSVHWFAAAIVSGLGHIQSDPIHSIERDAFRVSCCGVDFSGPAGEQFLRKYQTDSSICSCYKSD